MKKRYAVIGLGLLGRTVARELAARGAEVIAVDVNLKLVQSLADEVTVAVRMDSTDREALEAQGVGSVDAAIVAIGENFQAAVLTTALLKEMGVPRVVSRAVTEDEAKILKLVNADQVVLVEEWVARRLAQQVLSPSLTEIVEITPGLSLARIETTRSMHGKTLASLSFRQRYGLNVVSVIKPTEAGVPPSRLPDPEAVLEEGDVLVVEGTEDAIERFAAGAEE